LTVLSLCSCETCQLYVQGGRKWCVDVCSL
jgi:hypothetical protein